MTMGIHRIHKVQDSHAYCYLQSVGKRMAWRTYTDSPIVSFYLVYGYSFKNKKKNVDPSLSSKLRLLHQGFCQATFYNLVINTLLDANADRKLGKCPISHTDSEMLNTPKLTNFVCG